MCVSCSQISWMVLKREHIPPREGLTGSAHKKIYGKYKRLKVSGESCLETLRGQDVVRELTRQGLQIQAPNILT